MSDSNTAQQQLVTELKVSAHLMLLNTGLYCVYHTPGSSVPDAATGLPGARISLPPGPSARGVTISGFREDGWLGSLDSAALIRVTQGPSQVLMTVYQMHGSTYEAAKLQVLRLVEGMSAPIAAPEQSPMLAPPEGEEADEDKSTITGGAGGTPCARAGDRRPRATARRRAARVGRVGRRGAAATLGGGVCGRPARRGADRRHRIPGGARARLALALGRGRQYCGSRGMALPILACACGCAARRPPPMRWS
ncbi:MAG: hypothetical protein WDN49_22085 [Acetobacteraceae bacterium]